MSHRALLRLLAAGAGARIAYAELARRHSPADKTWTTTNHRGEPVSLLEGPAVAAGAAAAAFLIPGMDWQDRLAVALAGAGAGAVGRYDDLSGDGARRGFRGHLGALAGGEVTTGTVKIAGIGVTGLAAALVLPRRRAADVVINAGLIAGLANLVNLFDLRPGRAIKVSLLAGAALAATGPKARTAVAAPAGAAIALLPDDLGERAMLGDAGANALGALLGGVAAATLTRPARLACLAVIAGLTAASEKISFTAVIARTPALRWADMLGRRPAEPAERDEPGSRPEGGTPLRGTQPR